MMYGCGHRPRIASHHRQNVSAGLNGVKAWKIYPDQGFLWLSHI